MTLFCLDIIDHVRKHLGCTKEYACGTLCQMKLSLLREQDLLKIVWSACFLTTTRDIHTGRTSSSFQPERISVSRHASLKGLAWFDEKFIPSLLCDWRWTRASLYYITTYLGSADCIPLRLYLAVSCSNSRPDIGVHPPSIERIEILRAWCSLLLTDWLPSVNWPNGANFEG